MKGFIQEMEKQPRKRASAKSQPAKRTQNAKKGKPEKKKIPWGAFFWTCFFIAVSFLFFYNRDNIRDTISGSQNTDQGNNTADDPIEPDLTLREGQTRENAETDASSTVTEPASQQTTAVQAPTAMTAVLRDREIYFINVDRDGTLLRTRVNRSLPVSDSPLTDTISALLAGPNSEESRRGLLSFVPDGTRILSATVQGNTAYINFSEDFQFNRYGVEGYAGSLRQVIWTATEFANVANVQILIEGRRLDYLGEGVWIGSPLTRDSY